MRNCRRRVNGPKIWLGLNLIRLKYSAFPIQYDYSGRHSYRHEDHDSYEPSESHYADQDYSHESHYAKDEYR